ncbi:MAG: hypothetical protein QF460_02200 [Candidatus Nanoarchaeia archaeon]|jgi:hypothetical protein|nr:hypothetical protein [Candidatus Nanoarchaeia archaeon]|tara:strand:+ start:1730 stop:2665 length:936 start_codon:yes stop_codon:yes gene_type:complete
MLNLTIRGNIRPEFVKAALFDIYLKWRIPGNIEELLVIDNPKYFKEIEKRIPVNLRKEFRETYFDDPTSMSITAGKFDLIIISISSTTEKYLRTNSKALQGVMSHELMHVVQRRQGLDRKVRSDAIRAYKEFLPRVKRLYSNMDKAHVDQIFAEVGRQANFVLKDLYANDEIIKLGLGDGILADYSNYYGTRGSSSSVAYVKTGHKKVRKKIGKDIYDSVNYILGLMPVIVPFERWYLKDKNRATKAILNYISANYESRMTHLSKEMAPVINYSIRNLRDTSTFRKSYFKKIFQVTEKLIRESPEYEFKRQ